MKTSRQKTAKVAISLPQELLNGIERTRRVRGETRSKFFRHAIEAWLRHEQEREAVAQYVKAYREHPETEEEIGWVAATSQAALAEYPWDGEAEK